MKYGSIWGFKLTQWTEYFLQWQDLVLMMVQSQTNDYMFQYGSLSVSRWNLYYNLKTPDILYTVVVDEANFQMKEG